MVAGPIGETVSDTNDLNYPIMLDRQLSKYANAQLHSPTDFSGANNMFSNAMKNPSFTLGPGGTFLDPSQTQNIAANNYLTDRGNIAANNLQNNDQLASLLLNLGSSIGNITANQTGLEASQMTQNASSGGLFGGLL